jgi:predicted nuclease of predicted toxin-antitoxin system
VRLLFDEQLSEELSQLLRDVFPASLHVRQLGASGAKDTAVWELAKDHECLLVTKDEDFHRLSILQGSPPKVIWLRIGNCRTGDISVFTGFVLFRLYGICQSSNGLNNASGFSCVNPTWRGISTCRRGP